MPHCHGPAVILMPRSRASRASSTMTPMASFVKRRHSDMLDSTLKKFYDRLVGLYIYQSLQREWSSHLCRPTFLPAVDRSTLAALRITSNKP
jgi:hypothetical protein